jgi:hypothetical protein
MADNGSQQRKSDFRTAVKDVKAVATVLAMEAESILGRRTARVLGALALFAGVVGILVWYIAPSGAAEKQALVVTLAQILGGTALLSGLYFTWRTLQVNREGQITERFTRAIEQLGATHGDNSKNLELRLGGIYALERISRESEGDHWSIMEVLTAYVRQHAPRRPVEAQQVEEDATVEKESVEDSILRLLREKSEPSEESVELALLRFLREKSEASEVSDLAADIQAIMTVIRRRTRSWGHGEPEPLDLHETNLPGTNLERADLMGANLSGANLSGADLSGANLSGADLTEANLSGADLQIANLSVAVVSTSTFRSRTSGRYWTKLYEANLSEANLGGANLSEARFWETDLSGADLSGADLAQDQLEEAIGDETTQLPPGLKPPRNWGCKE